MENLVLSQLYDTKTIKLFTNQVNNKLFSWSTTRSWSVYWNFTENRLNLQFKYFHWRCFFATRLDASLL